LWKGLGTHLTPFVTEAIELLAEGFRIQDPVEARFDGCFLPIISAVPALTTALVLVLFIARPLRRYRPQWLKSFVPEIVRCRDSGDFATKPSRTDYFSAGLILISAAGFVSACAFALFSFSQWLQVLPAVAWVYI